jgi:Trypsin-like peptidase domain
LLRRCKRGGVECLNMAVLGVKRDFLATIFILLTAATATASTPSAASDQAQWIAPYQLSTVEINSDRINSTGQKPINDSTGVIVETNVEHRAFLITAQHTFLDAFAGFVRVRFWNEQMLPFNQFRGTKVQLVGASGRELWISPSDGSDIAVLDVTNLVSHHQPPSGGRYLDMSDFGTPDDFVDGAPVLVIGFPSFAGADAIVRPLTRAGIIAWTDPRGASDRQFLVDASIFGGNSGGPVIGVLTGETKQKLLGIIVGIYTQEVTADLRLPGTAGVTHTQLGIEGLGSIGIAEPISKIRALIEAANKR